MQWRVSHFLETSVVSVMRRWMGVNFPEKKRHVTLERPLSCVIHVPGNISSPGCQHALGDKKQVEETMVPLTNTSVQQRTVVVEPVDAPATFLTVTRPQGLLETQVGHTCKL